jgi:MFS family permease
MNGLREQIANSTRSLRDVFRNAGLRRLQLAFAGSIVGDWAYAVAVAVYAYERGGPTAVGVLGVIRYVSLAVVTPFAATLGDRYSRRLVMVSSDLTRGVLVFCGAVLIASGAPSLSVYALAVVTSLCGSPFRSAQASLIPDLADNAGELAASNVASSTIESVGFFAGPALAGLFLAFTSLSVVYVFDGLTFIWSAALVLGIHPSAREREAAEAASTPSSDEPSSGFMNEVTAGYRTILGSRELRLLIGLYCAQTVVAGASLVFDVAIALSLLDLGHSGVGYLNATLGIGGFIGGFVALLLAQGGRLARNFGIGVIFWAAPLLLVAAWPTVGAAVAVMIMLGLANSVVDVNAYTILQRVTPEAVMSRVFGAMESAVIGGMAVGALLMPILIGTIGLRWGLVVVGTGVSILVLLGLPGLRRIDLTTFAPPELDLLRRVSLLSLLPEPTLEALARALTRVEVPAGEAFIREGDHGDVFYVIESGTVEVTKEGRYVANLGPGDYVGEIALLRDVPRTATVTATSASVLQALDREHFIPAVTGQGEFRDAADAAIATRLAML